MRKRPNRRPPPAAYPAPPIDQVFAPLTGEQDDMWERYGEINADDAQALEDTIRRECVEYLVHLGPDYCQRAIREIEDAIACREDRYFEGVWKGSLPPFNLGKDKKLIFRTMVKVLRDFSNSDSIKPDQSKDLP